MNPAEKMTQVSGPEGDVELNEEAAKIKLVEELDKPLVTGQVPKIITCKSETTESMKEKESNFSFYKILEPKMANAKILELFCGTNTAKRYMAKNDIPGEMVGVDIQSEDADIITDVAKLPEKLQPEKQFDMVTSIGAHPGFEKFSDDAAYLKDDGLYIHGMTEDWLEDDLKKNILAWANGVPDEIDDPDVAEAAKYFQIATILKLNDTRKMIDRDDDEMSEVDGNEYYFICKKKSQ